MKISIGKAANLLGVSKDTLRRWEKDQKITSHRTLKGHRRCDEDQLSVLRKKYPLEKKITIGYASV